MVLLTEALAEADTDGVERCTEYVKWHAGLNGSMPDTRAVEMHHDAALAGEFSNTNYFILWKYRSVERILYFYHLSGATATSSAENQK